MSPIGGDKLSSYLGKALFLSPPLRTSFHFDRSEAVVSQVSATAQDLVCAKHAKPTNMVHLIGG